MARHKHANAAWVLVDTVQGRLAHEDCKLAVLMDIRDELQGLRRIFECANFLGMPAILRQVAANTKKRKRKTKRTT